jgi:hypothetical protein
MGRTGVRESGKVLNGEQIATALEDAGLFSQGILDVLVTAQVTRSHLAAVLALHASMPWERSAEWWRAVTELVACGMSVQDGLAWRALGFSDLTIEDLWGLDITVAARFVAADPEFTTALPHWVHLLREAGVPDGEMPGWLVAGLVPALPVSHESFVHTIQMWRARLGARAVTWAAAGYALTEACTLDAEGRFDADGLAALAALRSGAGHGMRAAA